VPGRPLHRDEALEAVEPQLQAQLAGSHWQLNGGSLTAPAFRLELIAPGSAASNRYPGGLTPEVITVVHGTVVLEGDDWEERLGPRETAVVPADVAAYRIAGDADALAALGSLA
jgi:hypothetical protein